MGKGELEKRERGIKSPRFLDFFGFLLSMYTGVVDVYFSKKVKVRYIYNCGSGYFGPCSPQVSLARKSAVAQWSRPRTHIVHWQCVSSIVGNRGCHREYACFPLGYAVWPARAVLVSRVVAGERGIMGCSMSLERKEKNFPYGMCGRDKSFRLMLRLSLDSVLHLEFGVRGRTFRAPASISSTSSGCASSLVTWVVVMSLMSVAPALTRSSELSLLDESVILLLFLPLRVFAYEFVASTVHSPPKRVDFSTQNTANVSIPLSSEGGSSLNIRIRRVIV